jgi:YggT family protein
MSFVHFIIRIYIYILIISAILSWLPSSNQRGSLAGIKRIFHRLTEPVLRPLRAILPTPNFGGVGIDLSVLVAVVVLAIINVII